MNMKTNKSTTKERAIDYLKNAKEHKKALKHEIEREFAEKGETVNVVFL